MSTAQQAQAPTSPPEGQSTRPASDYETIRAIVAAWPPALRAMLMHDLINILLKENDEARPRRKSLEEIRGILSNVGPPPTDEEVERILDEHRQEKYG